MYLRLRISICGPLACRGILHRNSLNCWGEMQGRRRSRDIWWWKNEW